MSFTFQIGSHQRPPGEVGIDAMSKETIRSPRGSRLYLREVWSLNGEVQVDRPNDLTDALEELENNIVSGRDVRFLDGNRNNTVHVLDSGNATNGVEVVRFDWGPSQGAEYSTYRSYSLVLQAEFRVGNSNELIDFQETITFVGGGPRDVWVELSRGPAQKQRVNDRTTYKAIQSGSAVGAFARPNPLIIAPPRWPGLEHRDRRVGEPTSPRRFGHEFREFGIRWRYEFESNRPLTGQPHAV